MVFPQALTIAGSDSGGGAGIQADLKTFQMCDVFGTSVLTAITAQNTLGVNAIQTLPLSIIGTQLDAVATDFHIRAFKIGMLGGAEIIEYVAEKIQQYDLGYFVLDPVMVAKGGAPLLPDCAIQTLKQHLLPLAHIITPNLPETQALTGIHVIDQYSAQKAAEKLQSTGVKNIVIKGGHADSQLCQDWIFLADKQFILESPRINTVHTHGTGCTFSAYLTAQLAKGRTVEQAICNAKRAITAAIASPLGIGTGHGAVNHWAMIHSQYKERLCLIKPF